VDAKFHPAIAAIMSADLEGLRTLLAQDPSLATARSSRSHPTLLQCLTLDAVNVTNKLEMAQVLIDGGAEIDAPLIAAASINNVEIAELLLDRGAAINGNGSWSPLEEALYWGNQQMIELLIERGASADNLRIASGLGRVDLIETFFNSDDSLTPEAGKIEWPFGAPQESNLPGTIKDELLAKLAQWPNDRQGVINNALVYACMHNHIDAARLLLQKGAQPNVIAAGFDYSGTCLHYAAVNGHRAMAEFLIEQGGDANVRDTKVGGTPAGWAEYGGHVELKNYLDQIAQGQTH
jgi:ankyrin repeat protein